MPWWGWLLVGLWAGGLVLAVALARAAGAGDRRLAREFDVHLDRLVAQVCEALDVERGALLLRSGAASDRLTVVAEHGTAGELHGRQVAADSGVAAHILTGGRAAVRAAASAPVVLGGRVQGALSVGTADPARRFDERDLALLDALADRCAAVLSGNDVTGGGSMPAPVREPAPASAERTVHAQALASLAGDVAERMGLDAVGRTEVQVAACLGGLGELRSWRPEAGASIPLTGSVARFRRERWDGEGPHGLGGERIPVGSRVLAACDLWLVALRDGDRGAAVSAVRREAGRALDPTVADALLAVVGERGGRFEVVTRLR